MCQSKSVVPQLLFVRDLICDGLADWHCFSLSPLSPCFLLMYNYTLHISCFCHLLSFRSLQYQREAALLSRHQTLECPCLSLLSLCLCQEEEKKTYRMGFALGWQIAMRCAYNACIFHLQIADQNWGCATKQMPRPLKYLHAFRSLTCEYLCARSFSEYLTLT